MYDAVRSRPWGAQSSLAKQRKAEQRTNLSASPTGTASAASKSTKRRLEKQIKSLKQSIEKAELSGSDELTRQELRRELRKARLALGNC